MAAFISGGLVPAAVRGTLTNATVHICDWLHVFVSRRAMHGGGGRQWD